MQHRRCPVNPVTDITWHHTDADPWQFGQAYDDHASPWAGVIIGERFGTFGTYTESRCSA
jgi:hypothetical protein